jgi:excisionase family DNA binding protein
VFRRSDVERSSTEVKVEMKAVKRSKQANVKPGPDRSTELAARVAANYRALRAQDVAELLGVTRQHIYKLASKGLIPSFRVGTAVRFDPAAVAVWLGEKMLPHAIGATDKIGIAV